MLQSGGEAGWDQRAPSARGRQRIAQVHGTKVAVATSSGLGRGDRSPPASWRQPSAEGVKASQHVWLLMIVTHQGPGEY